MAHTLFLLAALSCGLVISEAVILDMDLLLDNVDDHHAYETIPLFNQSRDAKHSYGHRYGHYRPYYRPTTTHKPIEPPLECGAGPFDGGPPLLCMLRTECIAQGGRLGEPCGRGFSKGFCCQFPNALECGTTTSAINSIFRNPDYPDTTDKPVSCVVSIIPRPEACGIRLEFMDATMGATKNNFCYQDMFTILGGGSVESGGFNTNFCGLAKGYATVIPVNQTSELIQLVVLSQSRGVMWNINVTQIHCGSLYIPFNDLCGARNSPIARKLDADVPSANTTIPPPLPLPPRDASRAGNATLAAQGKILGGADVGSIQYPWMGTVTVDGTFAGPVTLISRQWVITAASVVNFYHIEDGQIPLRRLRVQLGTYDRGLPMRLEPRRLIRKVDRIYMHNEFQGNSYDLAILKLNETVIYNAAIRPICFPEDIDTHFNGWNGIIAGWGSNGGPALSNVLLHGTVPIVGNAACRTAWSSEGVEIKDSMICAGDGSVAQCNGDRGGPLMVSEEDGLYSLVGISSFTAGPACGNPNIPDVYLRTSYFIPWVALVLALPPPPDDFPSPFGPYGNP